MVEASQCFFVLESFIVIFIIISIFNHGHSIIYYIFIPFTMSATITSEIVFSSSYHHNHKLHSYWVEKNPQGEADKHFLRLLTFCGWGAVEVWSCGAVEVRYCPNKEAIHRPLGGLWTLDADKNHLKVATIHKSTVNTRTDNRNDKKGIFFRCIWNIFQVMSPHHSDQMSQRSQFSRVIL